MVIDCPGCYERKIVACADGKAYLCKQCYANLMNLLMDIIRPAAAPNHPHLNLIKSELPQTQQEEVA